MLFAELMPSTQPSEKVHMIGITVTTRTAVPQEALNATNAVLRAARRVTVAIQRVCDHAQDDDLRQLLAIGAFIEMLEEQVIAALDASWRTGPGGGLT